MLGLMDWVECDEDAAIFFVAQVPTKGPATAFGLCTNRFRPSVVVFVRAVASDKAVPRRPIISINFSLQVASILFNMMENDNFLSLATMCETRRK